jgi:hypothetical protein
MNSFARSSAPKNFARGFAVFFRIDTEIEIDDLDAGGGGLFFETALLGGFLRFQIEGDHIGRKGDGRFQAEIALRHVTEARQLLDLRKTLDIGGVAVGILLEKIVTPADDGVEGLVALECGNDMHLARLTDDDASGRQIQLDFTSGDIGNLGRQNRHGEKGESQHRKMPESVEPHEKSSLSSKTKR